jgi:hypothetical protein
MFLKIQVIGCFLPLETFKLHKYETNSIDIQACDQ